MTRQEKILEILRANDPMTASQILDRLVDKVLLDLEEDIYYLAPRDHSSYDSAIKDVIELIEDCYLSDDVEKKHLYEKVLR